MSDFLKRYVGHNFVLKVAALAAAMGLWAMISREPMVELAYSVPIEFHEVPENLEVTAEIVPQAQVRVRGPVRRLRDISSSDVHTVIRLSGVGLGERTFDLTPAQVRLPHGLEVVQVIPTHLRLTLDRRAVREVPVKPRVKGAFPSGYGLARVFADPPTITIVGPEKRVNAINAAMTDPIDASGVIGRATFSSNAFVADPLVREMRPAMIRVTVVTERQLRPAPKHP